MTAGSNDADMTRGPHVRKLIDHYATMFIAREYRAFFRARGEVVQMDEEDRIPLAARCLAEAERFVADNMARAIADPENQFGDDEDGLAAEIWRQYVRAMTGKRERLKRAAEEPSEN